MHRTKKLGRRLRAANAGDHVDWFAKVLLYEQLCAFRRIAAIAIDHQDQISIDRCEGPGHRRRSAITSAPAPRARSAVRSSESLSTTRISARGNAAAYSCTTDPMLNSSL